MTTISAPVADPHESRHKPSAGVRAVAVGLLVPVLLSAVLAVFVALAVHAGPHDVTVDIVAPPPVVDQLQQSAAAHEGITLRPVESRDAAVTNIENRSSEGALVVSPTGAEVLVASAASPALSQLVGGLAAAGTAGAGAPTVTDVVAPPSSDARASGLASATFPYMVAGLALGAAAVLAFAGRHRLTVIVVGSAASGALFPAVMWWLGVIDAHYLAVAGATMLTVGASAATMVGLGSLLGTGGLGLGAVTMMLIGNPLSGAATSPLLVPQPWATIGQSMPPGAGASLVRLVAYFPQAGVGGPVVVLTIWLVCGLALWAVAARREESRSRAESRTSAREAALA